MSDRIPTVTDVACARRDGYLVVRNFVNPSLLADLLQWTAELQSAPEVSGRHWVYHEDSVTTPGRRVMQRIENFCPYHAGFDRFIRDGALARWSGALMGGPVVLFKDKINFKMPGGAGFKAHQDQQAGWTVYAPLFVTAMVTLDAATLENGCLEVAAGRHREGLIGEQWKPLRRAGTEPGAGTDRSRGCHLLRQLRTACLEGEPDRLATSNSLHHLQPGERGRPPGTLLC